MAISEPDEDIQEEQDDAAADFPDEVRHGEVEGLDHEVDEERQVTGQAEKEANCLIFCRTFYFENFYFKANYFRTFNFRA